MPTNDILPFCATDSGTNLETQVAYVADPNRAIGNQPGVASSKFVNKAIRQATYMASCLAQFLVNATGDNVLDDATPANVIATMVKAFRKPPTVTKYLAGAGTYVPPAGVAWLRVRMIGGGSAGTGPGGAVGTPGGDSTFGAGLLSAGGAPNSAGGVSSLGAATGTALSGTSGGLAQATGEGGQGASSPFGGGGGGGGAFGVAGTPAANTGAGGGGSAATAAGAADARGGGAGGYVDAIIATVAASYAYSVGAGGTSAFTAHVNTGYGAAGMIEIEEHYN